MERLLTFTRNVEVEYLDRIYIVHADNNETRSISYDDAIYEMIGIFENENTAKQEIQEMKTELEKYGTLVFTITFQDCQETCTEATLGIDNIHVKGRIDSWDPLDRNASVRGIDCEKALYNQLVVSLYDLIDIIKVKQN